MRKIILAAALLPLAACSKPAMMQTTGEMSAYDVAEPEVAPASETMGSPTGPGRALIAYSYSTTYRLDSATLPTLQARHTALCTSLGPARCRVVTSSLNGGGGARADHEAAPTTGETRFLVDARIAKPFLAKLDQVNAAAGGAVADRSTESEDVTKQIIDTDARVRAKQALADRLVKLIGNANAKVGDLVEAERAFATTQEELDAARSLQAALRQRVAMSTVAVSYTSLAAERSWGQVGDRIAGAGETLAGSIAILITFLVAALPWAIAVALLIWAVRRLGWRPRWPWRRRPAPPSA